MAQRETNEGSQRALQQDTRMKMREIDFDQRKTQNRRQLNQRKRIKGTWKAVMKKGIGMEELESLSKTLLMKTMLIDTTKYAQTTAAIAAGLRVAFLSI